MGQLSPGELDVLRIVSQNPDGIDEQHISTALNLSHVRVRSLIDSLIKHEAIQERYSIQWPDALYCLTLIGETLLD
jgi:predicted transcriptional regulator